MGILRRRIEEITMDAINDNMTVNPSNGFWASKRRTEKITKIIAYVTLSLGSIVMILPVIWMLSTSFKANTEVFKVPSSNFAEIFHYWVPLPLHTDNYPKAWTISGMYAAEGITFTTYTINTLIIAISACVGVTLTSSLVAFAFARLRFPGRGPLFILCLATMMIPTQVTMIPTFILFKTMRWYDTFYPLIVPAFLGGGAYNIFLMRQFFMSIPYEMDEAAKIDGCTNFGVYLRILLSLSKSSVITVAD